MIGIGKRFRILRVPDEAARLSLPTPFFGLVWQIDNDMLYAWSTNSNSWVNISTNVYPKVPTYADLEAIDPALHFSEIYIVCITTGVPFINQKPAGFYMSDGISWKLVQDISAFEILTVNKIKPAEDSVTAIQVVKFDGSTVVLNIDTLNSIVGVGTINQVSKFSVNGSEGKKIKIVNTATDTLGIDEMVVSVIYSQTGQAIITLPAASSCWNVADKIGRLYLILDYGINAGTYPITIIANGTDYIYKDHVSQEAVISSDGGHLYLQAIGVTGWKAWR